MELVYTLLLGVVGLLFHRYQLHYDNDQRYQKHEQRDPVNTMHITHPGRIRRIGIAFFYIEILLQLSPNSHKLFTVFSCLQNYKNTM
jgi:hypothetical protein